MISRPVQYLAPALFGSVGYELMMSGMESTTFGTFLKGLISYFTGVIIAAITQAAVTYYSKKATMGIRINIRNEMLKHILVAPLTEDDKEHSGQMVARNDQDTDNAARIIGEQITALYTPLIVSIVCITLIFIRSWLIGLITFVSIFVVFIFHLRYGHLYRSIGTTIQQSQARLTSSFSDSLAGAFIIRTFVYKHQAMKHNKTMINKLFDDSMCETKLRTHHGAVVNLFAYSSATIPFVIGSILVAVNQLTFPGVMYITQLSKNLLWFADSLASAIADLQKSLSCADRVFEIIDRANESDFYGNDVVNNGENNPIISFKNLSVKYGNKYVLRDISIDIEPGTITAFVGRSGAGKSTMLKVIQQFVKYEGELMLFGKKAEQYSLKELRKNISYVSQDVALFNASIYDNILYGRMNASEEEVISVSEKASVSEFTEMLPKGYQTTVGERDMNLSGGQCQRITIARAFLKNAPILLLDEATSALDTKSEQYIFNVLADTYKSKTILVVAHKLSTVINADKIYVFKDGEVVEEGNHFELLKAGGEYAHLFNMDLMKTA